MCLLISSGFRSSSGVSGIMSDNKGIDFSGGLLIVTQLSTAVSWGLSRWVRGRGGRGREEGSGPLTVWGASTSISISLKCLGFFAIFFVFFFFFFFK